MKDLAVILMENALIEQALENHKMMHSTPRLLPDRSVSERAKYTSQQSLLNKKSSQFLENLPDKGGKATTSNGQL
jgi:hypothetical protein